MYRFSYFYLLDMFINADVCLCDHNTRVLNSLQDLCEFDYSFSFFIKRMTIELSKSYQVGLNALNSI